VTETQRSEVSRRRWNRVFAGLAILVTLTAPATIMTGIFYWQHEHRQQVEVLRLTPTCAVVSSRQFKALGSATYVSCDQAAAVRERIKASSSARSPVRAAIVRAAELTVAVPIDGRLYERTVGVYGDDYAIAARERRIWINPVSRPKQAIVVANDTSRLFEPIEVILYFAAAILLGPFSLGLLELLRTPPKATTGKNDEAP